MLTHFCHLSSRPDRSTQDYSRPFRGFSQLWFSLFDEKEGRGLSKAGPRTSDMLLQEMAHFVPVDLLDDEMKLFVPEIWRYRTINRLKRGMDRRMRHSVQLNVRWNVWGQRRTYPSQGSAKQTLEIRMMQGTLDADHIWYVTSPLPPRFQVQNR